jgi:phenylalanyl-tRNA synthetase beta chain
MRISLSLIQSFIDLNLPLHQVGETLTLLGIEVDQIINETPPFSGVVVADILAVAPHPDADHLRIATVTDGKEECQVVCGAPNCREGIKTAFAKVGAYLKGSGGQPFIIEKKVLRGIGSCGMLCSEAELSISECHKGICEFPREIETGSDVLSLLWDPLFELSLTPNLGHCMSALGIARELSAALQLPIKKPKISYPEKGAPLNKKIRISIEDSELCPRYMARLIEQVKIAPSPHWLQRQLIACGFKPISNVVDIAHFVLLKRGQPFHIFDFDQLQGPTLSVGPSASKQTFLGLDGIEREIPEGALLISDSSGPVAIGGILGGQRSAVSSETQNILIEAACFDPLSIRKTAKQMGLRTESSHRFEKGIDPIGLQEALDEVCSLILQICGGKAALGAMDLKGDLLFPKKISCRPKRVHQILGTPFSSNEIEAILTRLGFTVHLESEDLLQIEAPLFRSDINEEIDLIEEIARIYGYNNLNKRTPLYTASSLPHDPLFLFEKEVRQRLIALGLQEFLTSDLISPKLSSLAQELMQPHIAYLQALHAKTEEYSILRPSLLCGLMQVAKNNLDHKNQTIHAFEVGRIHFLEHQKLVELPMAALLLTGSAAPAHWSQKTDAANFYDLKGLLENLFEGLRIARLRFEPSSHLSFHPHIQANIYSEDLLIGSLGQIHFHLLAKLGIKQPLFFAELHLAHLMRSQKKSRSMQPISPFPSSERDCTLSLPSRFHVEQIFEKIASLRSPLLAKMEVIDLYVPEEGDAKNITLRFTYRDLLKTISFEEVETEHNRVVQNISKLLAK